MLEDDQFPGRQLAPRGRVVVLEHIDKAFPEEFQIVIGEPRLLSEMGGDVAFGAIERVGDDLLLPHHPAFLTVPLGCDCQTGDGDLLLEDRVNATGKVDCTGPLTCPQLTPVDITAPKVLIS